MKKETIKKTLKQQLIDIIVQEIESGVYQVGDILPREIDYQETYGISRITVRAAMAELENRDYVHRIKRKGTVVKSKKVSEPLLKIEGFTEEMKKRGIIPTTKDAYITVVEADKECSQALGIEEGTPIYELTRIRCINNVPVALFRTYLMYDLGVSLQNKDYQHSLYDYLRTHHQITMSKVKQSLSASVADEMMSYMLRCSKGEPILVLKRIGYTQTSDQPIEYTIAKYVGSRYEYYFELER